MFIFATSINLWVYYFNFYFLVMQAFSFSANKKIIVIFLLIMKITKLIETNKHKLCVFKLDFKHKANQNMFPSPHNIQ